MSFQMLRLFLSCLFSLPSLVLSIVDIKYSDQDSAFEELGSFYASADLEYVEVGIRGILLVSIERENLIYAIPKIDDKPQSQSLRYVPFSKSSEHLSGICISHISHFAYLLNPTTDDKAISDEPLEVEDFVTKEEKYVNSDTCDETDETSIKIIWRNNNPTTPAPSKGEKFALLCDKDDRTVILIVDVNPSALFAYQFSKILHIPKAELIAPCSRFIDKCDWISFDNSDNVLTVGTRLTTRIRSKLYLSWLLFFYSVTAVILFMIDSVRLMVNGAVKLDVLRYFKSLGIALSAVTFLFLLVNFVKCFTDKNCRASSKITSIRFQTEHPKNPNPIIGYLFTKLDIEDCNPRQIISLCSTGIAKEKLHDFDGFSLSNPLIDTFVRFSRDRNVLCIGKRQKSNGDWFISNFKVKQHEFLKYITIRHFDGDN